MLSLGDQRFFGAAWAGEDSVSRVEVSTDGGETWTEATMMGPQAPYSWTLWEYRWRAESEGEHKILARATSSSGRVQPEGHESLNGGYLIHHSRPLQVRVERVAAHAEADATAVSSHAHTIMYDMNAYAEENMRLPLDVEMEFMGGGGI